MADLTYLAHDRGVKKKLKDMGDGTHAEVVSTGGATEVSGSDGGPVPVTVSPTGVTPVDRSGTIATGGTAQQLMPANPDRKGFWIKNVSEGDLWINELGTATTDQPSFQLLLGEYWEAPAHGVPTTAISIIGANAGQAFSAREW